MATVFGISGLKSRLGDWRASWRNPIPDEAEFSAQPPADAELPAPSVIEFQIVDPAEDGGNLSLLLENLVIPRLIADRAMQPDRTGNTAAASAEPTTRSAIVSAAEVEEFTRLSLNAETHQLLAFVEHCLKTGSSVETIYVELLAPAARKLGEYWEDDSQDFVDVTMGLWRIQETLRELTIRIPPAIKPGQGHRSALFSPMPGEQHSLGTLMVTECFQRAGWDAEALIEPTPAELTARVAKNHYDLVGLTVSRDCSSETLPGLVSTIKAISVNPHVRIMVGGRVINEKPLLAAECGADATTVDAREAVNLADRLVPLRADFFAQLI